MREIAQEGNRSMARYLPVGGDMTAFSEPSTGWREPAVRCERVLLAGPSQVTAPLAAALDPRRYSAAARFESLAYLQESVQACGPDAVVIALGAQAHDDLAISAAVAASQPTVIWCDWEDGELIEKAMVSGVASYVIGDHAPERINAVLREARIRFEHERGLREELSQVRQALADRKNIERAKGLLMERHKLSEDEAYHMMRRIAMNRGKRVAEVAGAIVTSPSALQTL
jgi:response regulator NasT